MLGGENGRDIKPSFVTPALPRFDWREMQRWKISESALPLGSKVDFRAPTMWDQYKSHILGAVGLIVAQAVLIGWLFYYAREIAKVRDKVRALNANLEERVEQRTVDLSHARDRAEILLNEVNHRVANSLSIVTSLVKLQGNLVKEKAAKDALLGTEARIHAISSVHKQLYTSGDVISVRLDEYLSGLLHQIATSMQNESTDATLRCDLEPLKLPTNMTINLGVIVTELVINAFKYAYPFQRGEIRVYLRELPKRQGELVVEDDGVGRGDEGSAKGTGLGTKLVNSMARTMDAEIQYLRRQPGTAARLVFPVPG
jgi:two-component sensor histidine kinase